MQAVLHVCAKPTPSLASLLASRFLCNINGLCQSDASVQAFLGGKAGNMRSVTAASKTARSAKSLLDANVAAFTPKMLAHVHHYGINN
jgi:hypothetical protein